MQTSDRNGAVVGAVQVTETDEIMLISNKGTLVRTRVEEVSVQGRNTQGVRLIRLKEGEKLMGLEQVDEPEVEDIEESTSSDVPADSNDAAESPNTTEPTETAAEDDTETPDAE
jgi:DNA gyrase subunit A